MKEKKKLLIVVDMVNGFINEGAMHDPYIKHIIPENERLVKKFLESEDDVIFIKDAHENDSKEFKKFPKHCIKGTSESELVDELKKYEEKYTVIEKNSTSVFVTKDFKDVFDKRKENIDEVIITGCCSDICVLNLALPLQNYVDEENLDIKITVPENAIETYKASYHDRDEYNEMAKKLMKQAGISLVKKY